jgi:hypothetical protein
MYGKMIYRKVLPLPLLLLAYCATGAALAAPNGQIVLPNLSALEAQASEIVDVTLDAKLLGMATRFLDPAKPDEARAREIVSGLQGIFVRSFSFDTAVAPPAAEFDAIRRRIVGVRSRKENTSVEVFVMLDGQLARGLTVIAVEPKRFTLVNIVGTIDVDKLQKLEGQLGVPRLELDTGHAPRKPAAH